MSVDRYATCFECGNDALPGHKFCSQLCEENYKASELGMCPECGDAKECPKCYGLTNEHD